MASLGFSIYSIIHLQSQFYFFPSSLDVFISFSCLIAVARTSNTMLNERGECGHPCLVSDLRGNTFSFSQLNMMLAVGLSYMTFIMLRYVLCISTSLRVFIINQCLIFSKAFSAFIEMIIWLLFFSLLKWCMMLIDLWILNHPCILVINLTWSWCMILLMYCCIWLANILCLQWSMCSLLAHCLASIDLWFFAVFFLVVDF